MKKVIGILSILAIIGCRPDGVVAPSSFKTILLKSNGKIETQPDQASFKIALSCLDRSISNSKECMVEKSNELLEQLKAFGIAEDDILTTAVNMRKSYTWKNSDRVFEGYLSSSTVYATLRNIEKLDVIYTSFLDNEDLNLSGLSYSHSQLDSLKNEAYIHALEKSNILADKLLENIPESQKEILKIGNVEIAASLPESLEYEGNLKFALEESSLDDYESIAMGRGTVLVSATLYVEYKIK